MTVISSRENAEVGGQESRQRMRQGGRGGGLKRGRQQGSRQGRHQGGTLSLSPPLPLFLCLGALSRADMQREMTLDYSNWSAIRAANMSSTCRQLTSNIHHNSKGYDTQGPRKGSASFPLGNFFYPLGGRFHMKGISISPHIL